MAQTCTNCQTDAPDGQRFCGSCGSKLTSENLDDLASRIRSIELNLQKDQRIIELETATNIATKLMGWAKVFAFFAGVPIAVLLLVGAFFFGKSIKDIHDLATSSQQAVKPILDQARSEAQLAKDTASRALHTATEVNKAVEATKSNVNALRQTVEKRAQEADQLNAMIKASQSEVAALNSTVLQQHAEVQQLRQQTQTVRNEQIAQTLRETYPQAFGEHLAALGGNFTDVKLKKPGEIYLVLSISIPRGSSGPLTEKGVASLVTALQGQGVRVFVGAASLYASSGRTSTGIDGMAEDSCSRVGGLGAPPCLLYFNESLSSTAAKANGLISAVQPIPPNQVRYIQPSKLPATQQELLRLSGVDMVVVLIQR